MEAYLESVNWPSVAHPLDPILETEIREYIATNPDGWCTVEKALTLARLIVENRPETVVEVGVFGARSLIPMAMACRYVKRGVVFGFDPMCREAATEFEKDPANVKYWGQDVPLENVFRGALSTILNRGLTWECRYLRLRGEQGACMFTDGSLGVLSIDGNHSEKASCRDHDIWAPKVAGGGFLILDDTDWPSQAKALKMYEADGFELTKDTGKYRVFRRK